jgi:hypothetical protein
MKNRIFHFYEWREYYLILPKKINKHWRWFETVERRRALTPDSNQTDTLSYKWVYRIKEYNKIPGWDRPFESGIDDK